MLFRSGLAPGADSVPVFTGFRRPTGTAGGLGTLDPSSALEVFVPAEGTVYFELDGEEVVADETSLVGAAAEPFARYDPGGDDGLIEPGEHELVLVLVGTDGSVLGFASTFTVAR